MDSAVEVLTFHASASCMNGEALIFLGPSETGKSTICRLLSTHMPPVADDKVYLRHQDSHAWAVSDATQRDLCGPLSEQEAELLNGAPLKAIFRLHQASEPCVRHVGTLETCRYLTDAFFEILRHRRFTVKAKQLAFSHLAAVARVTPGYELYFDQTQRTRRVIEEALSSVPESER